MAASPFRPAADLLLQDICHPPCPRRRDRQITGAAQIMRAHGGLPARTQLAGPGLARADRRA